MTDEKTNSLRRGSRRSERGITLVELLLATALMGSLVGMVGAFVNSFMKNASRIERAGAIAALHSSLYREARKPDSLRTSAAAPENLALANCVFAQPKAAKAGPDCVHGVRQPFSLYTIPALPAPPVPQRRTGIVGSPVSPPLLFDLQGAPCAGPRCGWQAETFFTPTCEATLNKTTSNDCDQAESIAVDVVLTPLPFALQNESPPPRQISSALTGMTGVRSIEVSRGVVRDRSCAANQRLVSTNEDGEPICVDLVPDSCGSGFVTNVTFGGTAAQPPSAGGCKGTDMAKSCPVGEMAVVKNGAITCHNVLTDPVYGLDVRAGPPGYATWGAYYDAVSDMYVKNYLDTKFYRCPKWTMMVGFDPATEERVCKPISVKTGLERWQMPTPTNFVRTMVVDVPEFIPTMAQCGVTQSGWAATPGEDPPQDYGLCNCQVQSVDSANHKVTFQGIWYAPRAKPYPDCWWSYVIVGGPNL